MQFIQAILTGTLLGGVYGLMSMGLALEFGVMRIINFAHGALVMVGMYVAATLAVALGVNPLLTVFAIVPAFLVVGAVLYWVLFKPVLASRVESSQLIMTLGLTLVIESVVLMVFGPQAKSVEVSWASSFPHIGPFYVSTVYLIAFAISLAVSLLLWAGLRYTDAGRSLRAVVDDPDVAEMMGIDRSRTYALAMGLGTLLAGVGGVVLITYYPVTPYSGFEFLVIAFVAIILAGVGNVVGAFVGGIVAGVVQQLSATYLGLQMQDVGLLLIFIVIMLVRPAGLFADRSAVS